MATNTSPQENLPAGLPPSSTKADSSVDLPFLLTVVMVFMGVVGMFMLLFSLTYINDLQTLRSVPDLIWNFACGQPMENGIILPLLLTLSIVSFLTGGVLFGVRWWLLRHATGDPADD